MSLLRAFKDIPLDQTQAFPGPRYFTPGYPIRLGRTCWVAQSSLMFTPLLGRESGLWRLEGGGGVATAHDGADADGTKHFGGGNGS